jgi:uncharacterized protein (TIGR02145 family)
MTFKTGQNCSPNPVLSGSDILCIGSSTVISSNILGGIWSSSNPNVATVFQSLGIVNAISEGYTEITYLIKGINGCPDVSSKFPISIISKETKLDITGDNFVCEGNTKFLYSTIYPGYLKWSIQDTFIAIDGCVFQGGPSGPTPIANQICIKGKKSGLTTITFKYGGSGGCPELSVTRQIIVGKDKPMVTRPIFNDITSNSAKGIGEVIAACGSAVTARGIVWSTSPNTTIALITKTSAGIGTGSFTSTITGLSPNTTYYYRAYAINSSGIGYSDESTFTTKTAVALPLVSTVSASSITPTTASLEGNVTSDGGSPVTARGVVWSTNTNPTISLTSKTSNGSGTGSFSSSLSGLTPSTTYYVRAYATNSAGTGYGNEVTFSTSNSSAVMNIPCPGTPSVKDIDGNTYSTVQIGTQCWTKENLKVTKYRNGNAIPTGLNNTTWSSTTSGAYAIYDNDNANDAVYGKLYNWYAVNDNRGLCPTGWHISTDAEWTILTTFLGQWVSGGKLKSTGTTYWKSPNLAATNESGFSALPGGYRYRDGRFIDIRNLAYFWITNGNDYNEELNRFLAYNFSYVSTYSGHTEQNGFSVRCLKDINSIVSPPTLTTNTITAITSTSATTGGNITTDGGAAVISRGVVWSTGPNPTITLTTKTNNGTGIGSFTSSLTNLSPNTTYYVRAYATNSAGTGYGNVVTFATSTPVGLPTINTIAASSITTTTATSGGNVSSDGGAAVTSRGLVWSTSTNPTISLSTKTSNGSGTGNFTSSLSGLSPSTTYYVRAYATNSAGTGYGNEVTFTTSTPVAMNIPCPGISSISDIDGNSYNTVQIGTQCWTKENLKVTKYRDGTSIPTGLNNITWENTTSGAYAIYGNDDANNAIYGKLYNWNAVADSRGLCPIGWHVPSDVEWSSLRNFLGSSNAGGEMKSTVTQPTTGGWNIPNTGATNSSGFTALPGGYKDSRGNFVSIRDITFFWSATEAASSWAWYRSLGSNYGIAFIDSANKQGGFSIRCLKDTLSIVSIPTLTTNSITVITTTSAKSGGSITADGGTYITNRGVVWSTSTNPTISLSTKTSDGSGIGSFTSSISGLTAKTKYYLRAYATNGIGTNYGNEISFIAEKDTFSCVGSPTVTDIDNYTYKTVQIGTQCWMGENLKVSKYRNGAAIPTGLLNDDWLSTISGAYVFYENNNANDALYGKLYNWNAVKDFRGLCPTGWHVPTRDEWDKLVSHLGGNEVAGGKKKSVTGWNVPNTGATNVSRFTGLPGGWRDGYPTNSIFIGLGSVGVWWNSSEDNSLRSWVLTLDFNYGYAFEKYHIKADGVSVRCLKDTLSIVSIPNLTTTVISTLTTTSATSGGIITSDGGFSITSRGVVWSTSPNPTVTLSTKTSNGTGTGSFTSSLSGLTPSTTYYVRAYATNSAGTGYGNEITFTTSNSSIVMGIPCPGTPTVKDIDGNTYNTVQIGTQCWTKENLRVTKYRDGTIIPLDESGGIFGYLNNQTWSSRTKGARTVYYHSADSLATYGYLYNWYAVADTKGLCPSGWHVPSDSELTTLTNYLGGESVAGGKMKSTGTTIWNSPNTGATNESGFSALPGGYRSNGGSFSRVRADAFFWSATEGDSGNAWYRYHSYNNGFVYGASNQKQSGFSVRCLRD